jgi:hypothetical protein
VERGHPSRWRAGVLRLTTWERAVLWVAIWSAQMALMSAAALVVFSVIVDLEILFAAIFMALWVLPSLLIVVLATVFIASALRAAWSWLSPEDRSDSRWLGVVLGALAAPLASPLWPEAGWWLVLYFAPPLLLNGGVSGYLATRATALGDRRGVALPLWLLSPRRGSCSVWRCGCRSGTSHPDRSHLADQLMSSASPIDSAARACQRLSHCDAAQCWGVASVHASGCPMTPLARSRSASSAASRMANITAYSRVDAPAS